jgi:HlyD family secretion protein
MNTNTVMDSELRSLKIDRSRKGRSRETRPTVRLIAIAIVLAVLLTALAYLWSRANAATVVETVRARVVQNGSGASEGAVILNATGYIVAAHKIELASKVVGKVAWIGVEKGDRVKQGQTLVRLEDDEYRAQVMQAKGNLENLQARLAELQNGSRPEEILRAKADVESSKADLANARVNLERTRKLVQDGVMARQSLDDAQARYDAQAARTASLQRTADLAVLGPRHEQMDQVRGQIEQARGQLAFAETQLANTIIKAPVSGTILERNVEKGEFVTTGFVGDRGAKGYVVSLADLNDLKVELDINQNDFAKLDPRQKAVVTTDAYPDRKYDGIIDEISPEANRQKATVQVKVKVLNPDDYLRPEMNASVAFLAKEQPKTAAAAAKPFIVVPAPAIKDGAVFVVANGKAVRRPVKTGGTVSQGVRIEEGLIGGEDVIVSPAGLKDGAKVKVAGK